jgi:hypothetical protein
MGSFQEFASRAEKQEIVQFFTGIQDILTSRKIGMETPNPLKAPPPVPLSACGARAAGPS